MHLNVNTLVSLLARAAARRRARKARREPSVVRTEAPKVEEEEEDPFAVPPTPPPKPKFMAARTGSGIPIPYINVVVADVDDTLSSSSIRVCLSDESAETYVPNSHPILLLPSPITPRRGRPVPLTLVRPPPLPVSLRPLALSPRMNIVPVHTPVVSMSDVDGSMSQSATLIWAGNDAQREAGALATPRPLRIGRRRVDRVHFRTGSATPSPRTPLPRTPRTPRSAKSQRARRLNRRAYRKTPIPSRPLLHRAYTTSVQSSSYTNAYAHFLNPTSVRNTREMMSPAIHEGLSAALGVHSSMVLQSGALTAGFSPEACSTPLQADETIRSSTRISTSELLSAYMDESTSSPSPGFRSSVRRSMRGSMTRSGPRLRNPWSMPSSPHSTSSARTSTHRKRKSASVLRNPWSPTSPVHRIPHSPRYARKVLRPTGPRPRIVGGTRRLSSLRVRRLPVVPGAGS